MGIISDLSATPDLFVFLSLTDDTNFVKPIAKKSKYNLKSVIFALKRIVIANFNIITKNPITGQSFLIVHFFIN